jgi:hypothetical protein
VIRSTAFVAIRSLLLGSSKARWTR